MPVSLAHDLVWLITALAIFGIIIRPWGLPEAVWAVGGRRDPGARLSALLRDAARTAVASGTDVYLFLAGMMLLAEVARTEGLFDWVAALAVRWSRGVASTALRLVYLVGIVVTALLSNDATAVVLTPAVYAAARKAQTDPAAVSAHLRIHRQRGKLSSAHIQSGESCRIRQSPAAAAGMARQLHGALARRHRGDVFHSADHAAARA